MTGYPPVVLMEMRLKKPDWKNHTLYLGQAILQLFDEEEVEEAGLEEDKVEEESWHPQVGQAEDLIRGPL